MNPNIIIDGEAYPESVRKAIEGATRAVVIKGEGFDLGDGVPRTMDEIVDASEKAGKILVVVDCVPKQLWLRVPGKAL